MQNPVTPIPRAHASLHALLTIFKYFMNFSVLIHGSSPWRSLGSNFHKSVFVPFQTPNSTMQWKIQLSPRKILFQLLILSHFRVFISKCKLSLLKLSILHGFVKLMDHHCKFLSSHEQFWNWLRRLPMSEPGYSDPLTWYISLINTWSSQININ